MEIPDFEYKSLRYKDDVSRAEISNFCQRVVATKELKDAPMRRIDDCHYIHVNDAHVAIVAATKRNVNVALVVKLLHSLLGLFKSYFRVDLDEIQVAR